jgi:hypothetical protein
MKKLNALFVGVAAVALMFGTASFKKEGCTDADALNYDEEAKKDDGSCVLEFVADDATFSGWSSWTKGVEHTGADPSLGGAHAGNDSNSVRTVYWKSSAAAVNGEYPLGTVILKQTVLGDGSKVFTGMAKRGNGYDSDGNDWEYFMLNADGTIADDGASRGADLFSGMCKSCHNFASTDFVFTD